MIQDLTNNDPVELSKRIAESYRQYLQTTFHFKDSELRASFEHALESDRLSKGPYLESRPVFQRGATPRELLTKLLGYEPDPGFLQAIDGDRKLYLHQEHAIRCAFTGTNVVVATGTGSGKTEAFLLPILLHLYQEHAAGTLGSGIRAIVLYPMNALANDQRNRMGRICEILRETKSPFAFTFGQYIGDTPDDADDRKRGARERIALPGELLLREQMRKAPPHILLTNYSMLEYLLLRPKDSPLFDDGASRFFSFMVLDEAHQYRGTRGMEMAMLIRRLKQRLRQGQCKQPIRYIATSASLASDKATGTEQVAHFASELFGEPFGVDGVTFGDCDSIADGSGIQLGFADYCEIEHSVSAGQLTTQGFLDSLAFRVGASLTPGESAAHLAGRILLADDRAVNLRRHLTQEPQDVRAVADTTFADLPERERMAALNALVALLMRVKHPESGSPLISARYHLFLRSLEGAFVSYWPTKQILLDRHTSDSETPAFEIALCRECGQHYIVGRRDPRPIRIEEPIRDPSDDLFGVNYYRPCDGNDDDIAENRVSDATMFKLCTRCGQLATEEPQCGHSASISVRREEARKASGSATDRSDEIARCSSCGYKTADPVREIIHGTDGPHAVVATSMFRNLPSGRRKILAFADGRQEAAFFAWYLEESYRDISTRSHLWRIMESLMPVPPEGVSLGSLADRALKDWRSVFMRQDSDDEFAVRKNVWRALYREVLTDERRISLEGVGLIRWMVAWPDLTTAGEPLTQPPFSLTEDESRDAMLVLLDSIRSDSAVELRPGHNVTLDWTDLDLGGKKQTRIRYEDRGGDEYVRTWAGPRGRRCRFLMKLLKQRGISDSEAERHALHALRVIWYRLIHSDESLREHSNWLLVRADDDSRRLNPDWWRLHGIASDRELYRCATCRRLTAVNIRGMCLAQTCGGNLEPITRRNMPANHYRELYLSDLPHRLRVEEHTAQLDKKLARDFQRDFQNGAIDVLSCSTTFEVGVDLGDLDNVFLRNVPPESFNYAQRVGRAGRRDQPGFAVTYCRRSSHDLYHYHRPEQMLQGKVNAPILHITNDRIIIRHMTAVALSEFFRKHEERFGTVKHLFVDLAKPDGVAAFLEFLNDQRQELETVLQAIVPVDMWEKVGLTSGAWMERLTGESPPSNDAVGRMAERGLAKGEMEIADDFRCVVALEKEAVANRDSVTYDRAIRRANTLEEEDTLSFLSRKAIIPKYGFPVDVVELDTQPIRHHESANVSLQRDLRLAVAEFAPSSELVANKRVWRSYAVKRLKGRDWARWRYVRCTRCNRFERMQEEKGYDEALAPCCSRMQSGVYIDPIFGFSTNRDAPKRPTRRPDRLFTTRPYFIGFEKPREKRIIANIEVTPTCPGKMVVLCEGRRGSGFKICPECGATSTKRDGSHRTAYGSECSGKPSEVALGHEFVTDVLELRFPGPCPAETQPLEFAQSLAYALLEAAAEALEIPSTDLNVVIGSGSGMIPPVILYDDVPGGAGLVKRLEESTTLRTCLQGALDRVNGNCGCDETTSCYSCLRSYRNQFAHPYLRRGPVFHYVESILANWS